MEFQKCNVCPHNCNVDRYILGNGFCKSPAKPLISSICIHKGEEPVISGNKGICNVFFAHCNLQCVYCQNYQISRNKSNNFKDYSIEDIVDEIINNIENSENIVGFVSPSHFVPIVVQIIDEIRRRGKNPVFVYNSNAYDSVDSLKKLEGKIDVYLPDFKYSDENLGFKLSGVKNYPQIAINSIKEMYRQKGSSLFVNETSGIVESGLIIRHLLLPGFVEQSKNVLNIIADEISTSLNISLMSQYYPPYDIAEFENLNRNINDAEYTELIDYFYELGFYKGFFQELTSKDNYKPQVNENNEIHF